MIYDSKALYSYIFYFFWDMYQFWTKKTWETVLYSGGRTIKKTQWYVCNKLSSVNDGFFCFTTKKNPIVYKWIIDILAITIHNT